MSIIGEHALTMRTIIGSVIEAGHHKSPVGACAWIRSRAITYVNSQNSRKGNLADVAKNKDCKKSNDLHVTSGGGFS